MKILEYCDVKSLSRNIICYSANISELTEIVLFDHIDKPDYLRNATQTRCNEFFSGRILAQAILKKYFNETRSITSVQQKLPIWFGQIQGCISHSKNTVVVAISDQVDYLGIDIEHCVSESFAEDSTSFILTEYERKLWERGKIQGLSFCEYVTLIFSVKESLYKAVYPISQQYIDFLEVSIVQIDIENQSIQLSFYSEVMRRYGLLPTYYGYWKIQDNQLLTWVFNSRS